MTRASGNARTARPMLRALVAAGLVVAGIGVIGLIGAGASVAWVSAAFLVVTTTYLVIGLLIIERRPGNLVGPLILALGAIITAYLVLDSFMRQPGPPPASDLAALVVYTMDGPMFFLIGMLFLFFPDGRLPSPRWRVLVALDVVLMAAVAVGALFRPGSFAYYPWLENPLGDSANPLFALWEPAYVLIVLVVAVSALSLLGRWRRGSPVERAQLKWVAASAVLVAGAMLFYGGTAGPGQYSQAGDLSVGAALTLFPVAIGIAVLRYRLYEIDRLISRTLGWAIVTALLVAVFAAVVVALQAVLAGFTQGQTLAVAASTLVAFAMFQPVRHRVQAAVDRRFDRSRYDAQRTVDVFGEALRNEVDLVRLRVALVQTAGGAVHPLTAAVWLRRGSQ